MDGLPSGKWVGCQVIGKSSGAAAREQGVRVPQCRRASRVLRGAVASGDLQQEMVVLTQAQRPASAKDSLGLRGNGVPGLPYPSEQMKLD